MRKKRQVQLINPDVICEWTNSIGYQEALTKIMRGLGYAPSTAHLIVRGAYPSELNEPAKRVLVKVTKKPRDVLFMTKRLGKNARRTSPNI